MALFKISKGASGALDNQALGDGYCWFTYDDGKFYIDYTDPSDDTLKRKPLNADRADKDVLGNVINNSYVADISFANNTITFLSKSNDILGSVSLNVMTGASAAAAGAAGLVPAPAAGD